MLIIPHSRGAVYTRNAMIDSPQALRDRVDIRAFAPGGFIDPHLCKSIMHYESERDIVPRIDVSGRQRCKDTIIRLKPDAKASWFLDHKFTSPTFEGSIKFEIEDYMRQ
jgi:hypothetical protein